MQLVRSTLPQDGQAGLLRRCLPTEGMEGIPAGCGRVACELSRCRPGGPRPRVRALRGVPGQYESQCPVLFAPMPPGGTPGQLGQLSPGWSSIPALGRIANDRLDHTLAMPGVNVRTRLHG